ncbi:MAG: gfo/Idh/MocA family oxidoreductase [Verrucomicrobia bacterium]|nr:MAG: gfo/Idh/MocA family oxidoreductase [Verrucomicrobiota bacterium]
MRVMIVGMGVQGKKRFRIAGPDAVGTVDPVADGVDFRHIQDVPLDTYDAALCCVPDEIKPELLHYLLSNRKHVLVEKPLFSSDPMILEKLKQLAESQNVVCYTAYNHRFEPHVKALKQILDNGELGRLYFCKFFYGNGTARDVRNSAWRDQGLGVISDLGSHLLDWTRFLFGKINAEPEICAADCFENRAYDYCIFNLRDRVLIEYEMTLLSWRNSFRLEIFAELGTAHIDCLCKWGPSTLTLRRRTLPSGRPDERRQTLVCPDPTWKSEYQHFLQLCKEPTHNIDTDIWINSIFGALRQKLKLT